MANCSNRPALDELLADEMMHAVLQSAGLTNKAFVEMLEKFARCLRKRRTDHAGEKCLA